MSERKNYYALVDCNSCYASTEQIFRPDLRDRPTVVLSNNDGCIISLNQQAKELGLRNFEPFFKMRAIIDRYQVAVFSANFSLYGDISWRVAETLRRYSPDIEVYSIDESFLYFEGMDVDFKKYGQEIKNAVWNEVRMPVCVGIGLTKTQAKLANHAAKKIPQINGVCVLDEKSKWEWIYKRLAVDKIWGVGKRFKKRLGLLDIVTIEDFVKAPPKELRKHFNVNVERILKELQGEPCLEIDNQPPAKQQIYITRSFGEKTYLLVDLIEHISRYTSAAAEKLRKQNSYVKTINVFIQTSIHDQNRYSRSINVMLDRETNDTRYLIKEAQKAVECIFKPGYRYVRCGVGFIELVNREFYQPDLFRNRPDIKSEALMQVTDTINRKYGRDTMVFGAEGLNGKWSMKQEYLSPRYTTNWAALPKVKMN